MTFSIGETMRRTPALLVLLLAGVAVGTAVPGGGAFADDETKPVAPAAEPAAAADEKKPAPPAPAAPADEKAPAKAEEPKAPAPEPKTPAAPPKAEEKKDETPVTGTLYSVRLKTGRTVRGVVHRTGLWERRDRVEGWVEAKREDAGSGLRLWYPSLLDGFLFVSAKEIVQIEDLGALSAEEGLRITREKNDAATRADSERHRLRTEAEERAAKEAAASEARAEVEAARKEAAAGAKGAAAGAAPAGAMVPLDRAKRFADLLEKFPPSVWHPDTPKEIERRRITLDLFPTDEEKDFLSVYAEWREAYEFWKKAEGGPDGGAATSAKVVPK